MAEAEVMERALIVYESMFGATRRIAEAIIEGLRARVDCALVPVREAAGREERIVIVGAPTHAHGLSRRESRDDAVQWAITDPARHTLEPEGASTGVREWLDGKPAHIRHHAAFDTRADMPRIFTGSAAAAIDRRLLRLGSVHLDEPQSFLVDRDSHLLPGELERARGWGMRIAERIVSAQVIAS
ncbi:hypothetical protein FBY40_3018 [Microbacterium sp. SLBN-154]|uniref:hypothetical protein n=1 Tax=Microbacterium sp. SLBN-154 TaxID=2768458 RepID=UPI00114FD8DF|nr:hypothetical protein [Microbacterium sp. SLBN-154]TQK20482.1 hypothetical protein FBY40_3018 [Microbacterium sp. SLBN-154]